MKDCVKITKYQLILCFQRPGKPIVWETGEVNCGRAGADVTAGVDGQLCADECQ